MKFELQIPKTGKITWNKDDIKKAVEEKVKGYKGLVYTEETLSQAKNDRAELNNLKKALIDRRRKVKNLILEPYDVFESEVNEVVELIDTQAKEIDATIKSYEEEEKIQKKKVIKEYYDSIIGDLKDILPFEELFLDKYLNKTVSKKRIKEEISSKIDTVSKDLECIDAETSKYKINAKDVYLKTYDLKKALNEITRLEELDRRMEARVKAEEEARIKAEEEAKAKAEEEAKRAAEEEERRIAEEEARAKAEAQAKIEADIAKAEADRLAAEEALRIAEEERIKAEEERKRAEEERKRSEEERKAKELEEPISDVTDIINDTSTEVTFSPKPTVVIPPAKPGDKTYKVRIMIEGTMEQIESIGNILSSNGITFKDL